MIELTHEEIEHVSGGSMNEVYAIAAAATAAGAVGFLFGGPVGAVAAAASVAGHGLLIAALD
jgi:lactobin A/cerein 7B family class IIb bacteriocin